MGERRPFWQTSDHRGRIALGSTLAICSRVKLGRQPAAQGKGRDHDPRGVYGMDGWRRDQRRNGLMGRLMIWGFVRSKTRPGVTTFAQRRSHLLGLNHEKLSLDNNGINRRLTDVHGHVLKEIIT